MGEADSIPRQGAPNQDSDQQTRDFAPVGPGVRNVSVSPADSRETVCPKQFSLGTAKNRGASAPSGPIFTSVFWQCGKGTVLGVTLTLLCDGMPEAGPCNPLPQVSSVQPRCGIMVVLKMGTQPGFQPPSAIHCLTGAGRWGVLRHIHSSLSHRLLDHHAGMVVASP